MKKLNYNNLANGIYTVCSKDGVSIEMSRNDWNWMVGQYGEGFAKRFTAEEIKQIIKRHHKRELIRILPPHKSVG